jgi:hypothetical protein
LEIIVIGSIYYTFGPLLGDFLKGVWSDG